MQNVIVLELHVHDGQLREYNYVHCGRFVEYLEKKLPVDGGSGMSVVLDRLVERFLDVERYANDIRYVNYCIKCVSLMSKIMLWFNSHTIGVGSTSHELFLTGGLLFQPHCTV